MLERGPTIDRQLRFGVVGPEQAEADCEEIEPGARMVCQDNLEFMAGLPDASMKLIVTSPPYNLGKSYEKRSPLDDYLDGQSRVIAECVRLLHPTGSICWQVGNYVIDGEVVPLDAALYPIFKSHGLSSATG